MMKQGFALLAIAIAVLPVAAAAQPVPTPPAPSASPAPSAKAQPTALPQPAPSGPNAALTPSPAPAPSAAQPSAAPSPAFGFVFTPPPAQDPAGPSIREIDLSGQTLVTPGELAVRVLTSPDVVSVVARTIGREINLPQVQSGQFGGSAFVPALPWYLRNRQYSVEFVAAAPSGRTASVTLSVGLK